MLNYLSKDGDKQHDMYDILHWMKRPAKDEDLTDEEKEEKRIKDLTEKIKLNRQLYHEEKEKEKEDK